MSPGSDAGGGFSEFCSCAALVSCCGCVPVKLQSELPWSPLGVGSVVRTWFGAVVSGAEHKMKTAEEAATLADDYVLTHRGDYRAQDCGKYQSVGKHRTDKSVCSRAQRDQKNISHYFCRGRGHWKAECPVKSNAEGGQVEPVALTAPVVGSGRCKVESAVNYDSFSGGCSATCTVCGQEAESGPKQTVVIPESLISFSQ